MQQNHCGARQSQHAPGWKKQRVDTSPHPPIVENCHVRTNGLHRISCEVGKIFPYAVHRFRPHALRDTRNEQRQRPFVEVATDHVRMGLLCH